MFLTVAEDGTVRQHDLRASHRCRTGCPAPLVKLETDLSTLALSPLTPWLFVVAGEAPYVRSPLSFIDTAEPTMPVS